MSQQIAINPGVTEDLIRQFGTQSETLQQLTSALDREVNGHIGSGMDGWQGHQADEFNNTWNGQFKQSLTALHSALTDAQRYLSQTLEAYRQLDRQA